MADKNELSPALELLLEQKLHTLNKDVSAARELAHSEANRVRNQAFALTGVAALVLAILAAFGLNQFIQRAVTTSVEERVKKEVVAPLAPAQGQINDLLSKAQAAALQAENFAADAESKLSNLQQELQDTLASYQTDLSETATSSLNALQETFSSAIANTEQQNSSFEQALVEIGELREDARQLLEQLEAARGNWLWADIPELAVWFKADATYPPQIAVNWLSKTVHFRGQLSKQNAAEPSTVSSTGALFKLPADCAPAHKRAFSGPSSLTLDFRNVSNFNQFLDLPNGQLWIDEEGNVGLKGGFDLVYLDGISYDISNAEACIRSL